MSGIPGVNEKDWKLFRSLTAIERANYVYMYTDAMKHSQYYRAMNIVRRDGKMLYYLGSGNVDECLKQFKRDLCR